MLTDIGIFVISEKLLTNTIAIAIVAVSLWLDRVSLSINSPTFSQLCNIPNTIRTYLNIGESDEKPDCY